MKQATMRRLRQFHLYVGMVFAPAILFFAVSGAVQTIGWQDLPSPPGLVAWMASVHKHQVPPRPRRPDPPRAAAKGGDVHHRHDDEAGFVPLKIFVLLLSLGLIVSTGLGIAIALSTRATRRAAAIMLGLGIVLPVALLFA